MTNALRLCLLVAALVTAIDAPSSAAVLTFDDLTPRYTASNGAHHDFVAHGGNYGGFTWSDDFKYVDWPDSDPDSGYNHGRVSGRQVAYNYAAKSITVEGDAFNFAGVYLTAAWRNNLIVQIEGFQSDSTAPVYTKQVTIDYDQPTWAACNFLQVNKLQFSSSGGEIVAGLTGTRETFAMDNFTTLEAVPEPASLAMWSGLGLMGLIAARRRRREPSTRCSLSAVTRSPQAA